LVAAARVMPEPSSGVSESPSRREWIKSVFYRASELPPGAREAFLQEACAGKPELRAEIDDLLRFTDQDLPPVVPMREFPAGHLVGGRFRLVQKIGEGGMGVVYEAIDTQLSTDPTTASGARVGLKMIRPEISGAAGVESQFRRELMLSREVSHPNVCKMYDIGHHSEIDDPTVLFLTMELLGGETLAERLAAGPLDRSTVYSLATQLFAGLAEVHRKKIVHRDLKPGNIHLVPEGDRRLRLVLTDFGLARAVAPLGPTVTRMLAGTPGYTAPEQFETGECSVEADIYSLGVVLYEMAAGARYDAVNAREILRHKAREWSEIILRCLERDPRKRPQSVEEVKAAFARPSRFRIPRAARTALWTVAAVAGLGALLWTAAQTWAASVQQEIAGDAPLTFEPQLGTDASFTKDGRTMVFSSDRGSGVLNIWRQDLTDDSRIQITNDSVHATSPAISPDGRWIAYRSEGLSSSGSAGIYLMASSGARSRTLVGPFGRHPMFSPDGNRILYWTGHEGDYSMPTGRLWIVDLQTGARRQLHPEFSDARFPVWSPDGDRILFRGSRDNSARWNSGTDWWTSTGQSAATAVGAYEALRGAALDIHDARVFWARDRILFGARKAVGSYVWSLPVSGRSARPAGPPRPLTMAKTSASQPWLLPDGAIAFSQKESRVKIHRIRLIDGRPGADESISRPDREEQALDTRVNASFDGTLLMFTRRLGPDREVITRNPDTGAQKRLLKDRPAVPFLSPDGRRIAYSMPLNDRNPIDVIEEGKTRSACEDCGEVAGWHPDGKTLLYLTPGPGMVRGLWALDTATRDRRELLPPLEGLAEASWSDRGLAFTVRAEGTRSRIFAAPVPASGPVTRNSWIPVTGEDEWSDKPRWSPDGTMLYFLSQRDGFNCVSRKRMGGASIEPGEMEPVYHNHAGQNALHHLSPTAQGLAVSRDAVFLSLPVISGNIWLIRTPAEKKTFRDFFLHFLRR
jgi:serine/threonine protein kinase